MLAAKLKQRMAEWGVHPKKSLGQNFLINEGVVEKILYAVQSFSPPQWLEIGPGLGALTDPLLAYSAQSGIPFRLIELDREMCARWRALVGERLIEGDALVIDWATLGLAENTVLVSNLPYQIAASIVIERSVQPAGVSAMILMFQKEVAQRIAAEPKNKDFGLLSVIAQTFWRVDKLLDAGPRDFFPPPQIASRVLVFRRIPAPIADGEKFLLFVKACFAQRRKYLSKNLNAWVAQRGLAQEQLTAALSKAQISPQARAEELSKEQFHALFKDLS